MRSKATFEPFTVYDVYAFVKTEALAAEVIEDGFRLVRHSPHSFIDTLDIAAAQIPARWGKGKADPRKCADRLKIIALRDGATSEAIQALRGILPISTSEEAYMAEKLKAKKGANTEALKAAAKSAPVSKRGAVEAAPPKRRGNPEALAKAREARAANKGPDTRKIKVLVKPKDSGLRAGSGRYEKLEFVSQHKQVADVLGQTTPGGHKIDAGALAGMVKRGHIQLS